MATAALFSADPAMTLLGTSRVASAGRSYATPAGRDSTAPNVSRLSLLPLSRLSGRTEQGAPPKTLLRRLKERQRRDWIG